MEELKKNKMKSMRGKLSKRIRKAYNKSFIIFNVMFVGVIFSSCIRNIDSKIEKCYDSNDTLINLSDLYPEEWDTVCYFAEGCSFDEFHKRMGSTFDYLFGDIGSRLIIVNKQKVIYNREWNITCDEKPEGAYFIFENDPKMVAIPRKKAKFLIRKRDEKSFWVIHQE